jgi:tetratricopeptide (TPR) repeat protein
VVSLRVPAAARDHYEKALEAARAHHDDVYQREIMRALEIAPEFPEAYVLLAVRENIAGQYQAGIDHALRAQAIDPHVSWASILIAAAYNGMGQYQDAFVILSNLRNGDAGKWQATYEMARAEVGRNDADGALHWSKLALDEAPSNCQDIHLLRANALHIAHRWREATTQMELYLATNPSLTNKAAVESQLRYTRLLAEDQEQGAAASSSLIPVVGTTP